MEKKREGGDSWREKKKRWNLAIEEKKRVRIPILNSNPRFPETAGKSQTVGIHTVGVHASNSTQKNSEQV